MKNLCLVLALITLAGCTRDVIVHETIDTGCISYKPIRLTKQDVELVKSGAMSDSLVNQILTHNETGAERCGWKPNGSSATMQGLEQDSKDPLAFPIVLRNSRYESQDPLQNAVPQQVRPSPYPWYGQRHSGRGLLGRTHRAAGRRKRHLRQAHATRSFQRHHGGRERRDPGSRQAVLR